MSETALMEHGEIRAIEIGEEECRAAAEAAWAQMLVHAPVDFVALPEVVRTFLRSTFVAGFSQGIE